MAALEEMWFVQRGASLWVHTEVSEAPSRPSVSRSVDQDVAQPLSSPMPACHHNDNGLNL